MGEGNDLSLMDQRIIIFVIPQRSGGILNGSTSLLCGTIEDPSASLRDGSLDKINEE